MASKRTRVSTTTENTNRISDLPDAILWHILSFLPTIYSVRTRVLSTRWKHLFSLVPILVFDYHPSYSRVLNPNDVSSFLDFVNWVFNSYNVNHMDTFYFNSCSLLPEPSRLLSWISEAIRRRVQKLEIRVPFSIYETLSRETLSRDLFTCKTLSVLIISGNFSLDVPKNVCLPCVKTIVLAGIYFIDGSSAQRLFQCCPVLEELCINCSKSIGDIQVLDISVPSLKILNFVHGFGVDFDLVLDVPNVENFVYINRGTTHGTYSLRGLKSYAKADIKFYGHYHEGCKAIEELVRSVCHIRHLSLCGMMLKDFLRPDGSLLMFCYLTNLEIESISCSDFKLLHDLLDMTPLLQVLVLDSKLLINNAGFPISHENGHSIHFSSERVPSCVSLHLKKVDYKGFLMLECEFRIVEYFLNNAKILDMLKIKVKGSFDRTNKHLEITKKLSSFSRYSRSCQIVLI